MNKISMKLILLVMLLMLFAKVTSYASDFQPTYSEIKSEEKNNPDDPGNVTEMNEGHIEDQQKRLKEIKGDDKNIIKPDEIPNRIIIKDGEAKPDPNDVPNFIKDPIKEYKRVEIQKNKKLSIQELLDGAKHPEIIPSTPEEAGFDPDDDREFFHFTTKKGNRYFLIKDSLNNKDTLTLVTEASESDLLSLLSDSPTTDEILKEKAKKDLEIKKKAEQEEFKKEQEKKKQELEKEEQEKEKKVSNKTNIIYFLKWILIIIGSILILFGIRTFFNAKKRQEYKYDVTEHIDIPNDYNFMDNKIDNNDEDVDDIEINNDDIYGEEENE